MALGNNLNSSLWLRERSLGRQLCLLSLFAHSLYTDSIAAQVLKSTAQENHPKITFNALGF